MPRPISALEQQEGITPYKFHILASVLVNPDCLNLTGSGVVVHVSSFIKELEDLQQKRLNTEGRIFILDRRHDENRDTMRYILQSLS